MIEVEKYLTKEGKYTIAEDDNLFEKGYLDSMGILELISIIEDISNQEFNPEVFSAENFETIDAINKLIAIEFND